MRVLITGGAGLIGYHMASECLEQGHQVTIIDNLERYGLLGKGDQVSSERVGYNFKALKKKGVTCRREDVSDSQTFSRKESFDWVIHLAAQTAVPCSIERPGRDFTVNTVGTFNVLEAAREWGAKVAYASTNKVYNLHAGWELHEADKRYRWSVLSWDALGFPVDGGHTPHFLRGSRTPYGNSKYMGDLLCQEWYHMYGLETGIFRMSCIYGPNQFSFEEQGWLVWFMIANLKGLPITIFGDGFQVRDCLHVKDVVRAYLAFLNSDQEHGVWNLGGGPTIDFTLSLSEAVSKINKITGKSFKVNYEDWRPSDQRIYTSDIAKVERDLDWTPKITVDEGIEDIYTWVRDNLNLF